MCAEGRSHKEKLLFFWILSKLPMTYDNHPIRPIRPNRPIHPIPSDVRDER